MTPNSKHVAVIGGGIIGLASAHFLCERGFRVSIVDQGRIGGGCSHGNCGYVSPSHVLPLAEPGAILSSLKAMLKPNAPFRIRPGFKLSLWNWLWNFSRRCNEADCLASASAIHPLLMHSMKLYEELIPKFGLRCEWKKQGLLFVYRDPAALNAYAPTNDLLTRDFDEPAKRMSNRELIEFEPAIRSDVAGAWYFEHDAHLRPSQLVASWRDSLAVRGVEFIENESLQSFMQSAGDVQSASLSTRRIEADHFVIATGAWTPQLASILKFQIPIQPGKGYSITMPRPEVCPKTPMIFPERRVAVTPWQNELRLGSMMEFIGYDTNISEKRLRLLTRAANEFLKSDLPETFSETWYGWRPMTYDSTPVIGRCPGFKNVFLACGHNMLGLSMAPATGEMVSELISEKSTTLNAGPYRAERFG